MMPVPFFVLGTNHRRAPLQVREQLAMALEEQQLFPGRLISEDLAQEAAVLCTCNRVEIYGVLAPGAEVEDLLRLLRAVTGAAELTPPLFYFHCGEPALEHLFRVAASLDSQIVGETHILGQVKACYETARDGGTAGKWLNIFFQKSFQAAKKVRTETWVATLPVSTGSCAVALVNRIFGELTDRNLLLVGAGEIGRHVARHFLKHGVRLTVANRTPTRAQALAHELGGQAIAFEKWPGTLTHTEIAVFATDSGRPLLLVPDAARIMAERKNRPLLLLDLAVPRNVDPGVSSLEGVFLYDIDKVQSLVEAHYGIRRQEADRAERMVCDSAQRVWGKTAFSGALGSLPDAIPGESSYPAHVFASPCKAR